MSTKVLYFQYFQGVYYTRMTVTFANTHARMVRMVYTMTRTQNREEGYL